MEGEEREGGRQIETDIMSQSSCTSQSHHGGGGRSQTDHACRGTYDR